ncbi:four-helix bundle copper-binding protein [Bdellovibrio sp. HCB185ZH]|uniref:four-helix bundle copper-binding protein n=1 Tax=Bdellovibrio sp. HCB185ZH TaxID=3394235 RepID=UPI0039A5F7A5
MASIPMQDSDMSKCIKACMNCTKACMEALHYLLQQGVSGKQVAMLHMCAEACQLSSKMMLADLEFHHQACELSFELSTACAAICASYDDEMMARCAETCRHCSETCRGMAGMTVHMKGTAKDLRSTLPSTRL